MSTFTKSFLATGGPLIALSLISTAGAVAPDLYWLWFLAFLVWVLTFVLALGFAIGRRQDIAAGMFAAVGIGFLALATTCFANLATIEGSSF